MDIKTNCPKKLDNVYNFRDLGGYINKNGCYLKENLIFRSDSLEELSDISKSILLKNNIATVIDLRNDFEKGKKHPLNIETIDYYEIPIKGYVSIDVPSETLYLMYVDILENKYEKLLKIIEIIAKSKNSVVYHCTAGKDRTGLISMLILGILEVSNEQIILEYSTSWDNIKSNYNVLDDSYVYINGYKYPIDVMYSKEDTMRKTLDYINENYKNINNYLKEKGLKEEVIKLLKNKMLED